MTTKLKYQGRTENGKMVSKWDLIKKEVAEHLPNCEWTLTFQRSIKKRSNPQNKYYRGVICVHVLRAIKGNGHPELNEHNPDHIDHIHELLKQKFFMDSAPTITLPNGKTYKGKLTTTTETSATWEEKMVAIRQWAYDIFSITIPLPNEVLESEF